MQMSQTSHQHGSATKDPRRPHLPHSDGALMLCIGDFLCEVVQVQQL